MDIYGWTCRAGRPCWPAAPPSKAARWARSILNCRQQLGPTDLLLRSSYRTQGNTQRQMIANLKGSASLVLTSRVNRKKVRVLDQLAIGVLGPTLTLATGKGGAMKCVVGDMVFNRGEGRIRSLIIDTDTMTFHGKGQMDLNRQRIDVTLVPLGKGLLRGGIKPFVVRAYGPLTNIKTRLDFGALAVESFKTLANTVAAPVRIIKRLLRRRSPVTRRAAACNKAIAALGK